MKKKTSPEMEKSEQEISPEEMLKTIHQLANQGESTYQFLMKWQETNQLLKELVQEQRRQNDILEKDSEDEKD